MSREIMQQALDAFEDLKKSVTRDGTVSENWDAYYEKEYYALEALRQELAKPEPVIVPFPSFMRKRVEQAIDNSINPHGMSVYDGKAKVLVSDLKLMLLIADLAAQQLAKPEPVGKIPTLAEMKKLLNGEPIELAKPDQKPKLTDAGADANIDPFTLYPKGSGMVTLNQVGMRVDFKDGTRKPWVGLTDDEVKSIINNLLEDDPTPLLTLADVIQEKLKEKNGG